MRPENNCTHHSSKFFLLSAKQQQIHVHKEKIASES